MTKQEIGVVLALRGYRRVEYIEREIQYNPVLMRHYVRLIFGHVLSGDFAGQENMAIYVLGTDVAWWNENVWRTIVIPQSW